MLVVPGVGVVMSSLPRVRGVLAMRVMIVLVMAVVVMHHIDTSQETTDHRDHRYARAKT
jgi:hypothetical protein